MSDQYEVVYLTPGQIPPVGSTGIMLDDGGIMWIGEEGTFPGTADLGQKLDSDPEFDTTYTHNTATQDEIDEYNYILTVSGVPDI